ncbi:hypothetical protein [Streptomyces sp. NPDC002845]
MTDQIQFGQVYVACHPREQGRRLHVTAYTPGHARARIEDADSRKRPRRILARSLHQSATVRGDKGGTPRRTGYAPEAGG